MTVREVSVEALEALEERLTRLEALVDSLLEDRSREVGKGDESSKGESRRGVGENNLKMVYQEIFARLAEPSVGFPKNKRPMAEKMAPGQKVFVYVTSPYKKIIGLAEPTSTMRDTGHERWPYDVPIKWVIGPCTPGVSLKEAGLDAEIRPRPGDTNFTLTDEEAERVVELLKGQEKLEETNVHSLLK